MNIKNLKAYAPKARRQFIEAVKKQAAQLGIYADRIAEVRNEGGATIIEGRAFTNKQGQQRKRLVKRVEERGYEMFTREMAYTWFNRLAAIRYMELHDYLEHGFRVLSHPSNPDGLPEILDHASDVADLLVLDKSHIIELQLAGDREEELYRELLLGQCHYLAKIMPSIFAGRDFKGIEGETMDDATELLLPDNLTKTDSILKELVNGIPEEDWQDIEVIGWLYQFYISEHKDTVIGKVVKSEDIPAATQLFTPNWIVKYLVQNSLGRQWLATYPDSEIKGKMEYYIEPAKQSDDVVQQLKAITPTSIDPEQIKVLDPAAGSGHILVEVYEVLREIYLERGYRLREIPELILTKNIYGLDIDDRAAQLAGFALMMKAREDDRRIFQRVQDGDVALNLYSLQSTESLDIAYIWQALDLEGHQKTGSTGGLFDEPSDVIPAETGTFSKYYQLLQALKSAFLEAKTLGSLIQIDNQHLANLVAFKKLLRAKEKSSDPSAKNAAIKILPIINQAISLTQRYNVVVANPPYMGTKYQTPEVKKYLRDNFAGYEKDLFSVFIVRNLQLAKEHGELGFMTPFVWMFISSYEHLRTKLVDDAVISTLIQLEYSGFDGATVPICTFTLTKGHVDDYVGSYIRLSDFKGAAKQGPKTLEAINNRECGWLFEAKPDAFRKIPGNPVAYWINEVVRRAWDGKLIKDMLNIKSGLLTGNDATFQRYWYEINYSQMYQRKHDESNEYEQTKWCPISTGGDFRKWYGNTYQVVNSKNNFVAIKSLKNNNYRLRDPKYYFQEGVNWPMISSSNYGAKLSPSHIIMGNGVRTGFPKQQDSLFSHALSGYLSSNIAFYFMSVINPTLNFNNENVEVIPCPDSFSEKFKVRCGKATIIAESDWNSSEFSYGFNKLRIIDVAEFKSLHTDYKKYAVYCDDCIKELTDIERQNNLELNKYYGLTDTISSETHSKLITLFINPVYKYGNKISGEEAASRFRSDTLCELLSYSIGTMMGRYSLDHGGLVYAHSNNEGFKELVAEGAYQTYPADDDGIISLAYEDWLFDDDATTRFREFVKTVWDEDNLIENLGFVAESLCLHALKPKKGESAMDTIRRYFSSQFFKDHCKTYKKRPIYWLFSSGKEKAFECLVYLHRYNEGTLSRMRTEYVTPLMGKYDAQHSLLSEQVLGASGTELRTIEKDLKALAKKQAELRIFDEQLKHYADMRISLDLDDGVKVNYGKFGNLLADVKNIHGVAPKGAK
jgi:type II restriction/modification system DNA methylase subunit YeeA